MQALDIVGRIPRAPESVIPRYSVRYDTWDDPSESRDTEADSMTRAEITDQTRRDFATAVPMIRAEGQRHIARLRARVPAYVQAYVGGVEGVSNADIERAVAFVRNVTKAYASHRAADKVAAMAWKRVVASHTRLFPRRWYRRHPQPGRAGPAADITAEQSRARDAYVLSRRQRQRRWRRWWRW